MKVSEVKRFLKESNAIEGVYDKDSLQQAWYAWKNIRNVDEITPDGNDHRGLAPTDRHYDVGVDAHEFKPIRIYDVLKVFWEDYYGKNTNS